MSHSIITVKKKERRIVYILNDVAIYKGKCNELIKCCMLSVIYIGFTMKDMKVGLIYKKKR